MDDIKLYRNVIGRVQKYNFFLILIVFSTGLLVSACSPKSGSGIMRFFFDGVPEKKRGDTLIENPGLMQNSNTQNLNNTTTAIAPGIYLHTPYKERACTKCHTEEIPGKKIYSQDEVCYSCHKNYQEEYSIVHGPVAGGFCTSCHAPHYSSNKKLLLRKGQDICFGCHTRSTIVKNETHADIGATSCTECHNPHGGSDRYMSY